MRILGKQSAKEKRCLTASLEHIQLCNATLIATVIDLRFVCKNNLCHCVSTCQGKKKKKNLPRPNHKRKLRGQTDRKLWEPFCLSWPRGKCREEAGGPGEGGGERRGGGRKQHKLHLPLTPFKWKTGPGAIHVYIYTQVWVQRQKAVRILRTVPSLYVHVESTEKRRKGRGGGGLLTQYVYLSTFF